MATRPVKEDGDGTDMTQPSCLMSITSGLSVNEIVPLPYVYLFGLANKEVRKTNTHRLLCVFES